MALTRCWALAFLCLPLACGGSTPAPTPVPEPEPKPEVLLRFEAAPDTNGGSALHVLVRRTTETDYPRDEYDEIVSTLALPSDPQTVRWAVVLPGKTLDVRVQQPSDGALGVYFLFSTPGQGWSHFVNADARTVAFELSGNRIIQTSTVEDPEAADADDVAR